MNANPSYQDQREKSASEGEKSFSAPTVSLPKGGGAIRGIGEKFAANPVTGTGSMTVPIATSPGRSGFGPQLNLTYDSGSGNGPFGFGWSLSLPAITRKTDKGLPQYFDGGKNKPDSDVYILSGSEDLVLVYQQDDKGNWIRDAKGNPIFHEDERDGYLIRRYRPRIEGLFARIERWTNVTNGEIYWRSITRDNIITLYGKDNKSRIFDPAELDTADPTNLDKAHPKRVFSWLSCESYDDKGNAIVYQYSEENSYGVDVVATHEKNRTANSRMANRYLKRVLYGNRIANRDANWEATDPSQLTDWMFEIVFDYGDEHYDSLDSEVDGQQFVAVRLESPASPHWTARQDPFSSYRSSFEVRTYRLCRRVLMFHHFPAELGIKDYLVRSTEFSYAEGPIASFITSVTQSGYLRQSTDSQANRYLKKSLPPLEFKYSQVPNAKQLAQQPIHEVSQDSLENLPVGLDGVNYQWMDLDGEGTFGVLTEQADGWYYKRNLSANNQVPEDGPAFARFGPLELVAKKPAGGLNGGAQFLDLAGDGQVDLVQMDGGLRGFYERTDDPSWSPFQPFVSWPEVNTRDPDLKFVDLTGDGHADILITEGNVFSWYPSLAEDGFAPANRVNLPLDEEKGPRLIFADGTQSVYLADLSGDGLSDLVRIRNGEICYWPNLGYGHFGAKVTMDSAPWFDSPDQFDQKRIRLADTDGSGTTDIFYLRRDGVQIYFNQCGNRWSEAVTLPQFPPIENISAVQVLDLLGNGTACLVWSSPLPGNTRRPMRYLALMDEKPHLLIRTRNNLGAETRVQYASSTKFYLNDKEAGKPWITRLPFPVHVVERAETWDWISRNRFVTRYAYHHGYFDGPEREFRGFGMVEQWDTEETGTLTSSSVDNLSWDTSGANSLDSAASQALNTNWEEASYVPPTLTRTWFHTGSFTEEQRVSNQYVEEYYHEGDPSEKIGGLSSDQLGKELLADTVLPTKVRFANGSPGDYQLSSDEVREAYRSLKGAILRQEIYALDGTEAEDRPYSTSERNYTIELIQPRSMNKHAVFFTHAREQVDFHYERVLLQIDNDQYTDPRVSHSMTLEVDPFGNVLRSLAIGYPRRDLTGIKIQPEQTETHMTLTVNRVTNVINKTDWYRIGVPVETRTYEVVKPPDLKQNAGLTQLFTFDKAQEVIEGLFPLNLSEPITTKLWPYEKWDWRRNSSNAPAESRLRLIEHVRTKYRSDDLNGLLSLGDVGSLALPGESYKLAFTSGLFKTIYADSGKVDMSATNSLLETEAGYLHSEGDANWWIPSGRVFFSPSVSDSPIQELNFAREHFFLPHRFRDPFNNETAVAYDSHPSDPLRNHNLLLVETRDALGNVVTSNTFDNANHAEIRNDYRVLQPYWVTDPNNNRTQVTFDALGMVVATAVMGKPGKNQGDNLQNFEPDLSQSEIDAFHDSNHPHTLAEALLKNASTRIVYDLDRFYRSQLAHSADSTQWEPPYAATLARETHAGDPLPPHGLKIQISFSYSDGFGREIQKKIQAEPGEVEIEDALGTITVVDTTPGLRWVGSGWTIFNNKGKPVRQYEPFFSATQTFEFGVQVGVSSILFYDSLERVVATIHPNNTYEKVVFDPWQQKTYDVNDTVAFDPRTDTDITGYVSGYFKQVAPQPGDWETWLQQRGVDPLAPLQDTPGLEAEKKAAVRTLTHADTPTVVYFDTLGRPYLTIAQNKFRREKSDGTVETIEEEYPTRVELDIEGNQRAVRDAIVQNGDTLGRIVMRYDYDMLGNPIHQASMEAGERWMLNDVVGKPIRGWDSRGFTREMTYDALYRPTELFVIENGNKRLAERTEYGENQGDIENHRTRVYKVFDSAGVVTNERYDFRGNLLRSKRELLPAPQSVADGNPDPIPVDWNQNPIPNDGTFVSSTEYDALNRPLSVTSPDGSIYRPTFNEANLLNNVDVNLRGAGTATHFVTNIEYNAKGQRTLITYGNEATTEYEYDPLTFRLIKLTTTRPAGKNGLASQLFTTPTTVQELHLTYDPTGNIIQIEDAAAKTSYYKNQQVDSICTYTYDALYRLIEAHGREHSGQTAFNFNPPDGRYRDYPFIGLRADPNDPNAIRNYSEVYEYDKVGNIEDVIHSAMDGSWTRCYAYDEPSLLEEGKQSNRLTLTQVGNVTESYSYKYENGSDIHGCMTSINSMNMAWDFKDQLQMVKLPGGTAYYVYNATGQRVRKVIRRQDGSKQKERVYLGGFEIYREFNGTSKDPVLERESLHIMDDKQRIALVETRTQGVDKSPEQLIRYQFSNHLGSASLELDDKAQIISYEEYYPYGSTSYQAVRSQTETPKRYRYIGKEQDEETGFAYHGARYYAVWLGRWAKVDPIGIADGINLFIYVRNNPIKLKDPSGTRSRNDELPNQAADVLKKIGIRSDTGHQNSSSPIDQIGSALSGAWNWIKGAVSSAWNWTKDRIITPVSARVIDAARSVSEGLILAGRRFIEPLLRRGASGLGQGLASAGVTLFWSLYTAIGTLLFFEPVSRPLTEGEEGERARAQHVFGNSIDLNRVRIREGFSLLGLLDPGHTESLTSDERRSGQFNYVPRTINFEITSPSKEATDKFFLHEMTHVWQAQHGDPLMNTCPSIECYNWLDAMNARTPWEKLSIEQQAETVMHGYEYEKIYEESNKQVRENLGPSFLQKVQYFRDARRMIRKGKGAPR